MNITKKQLIELVNDIHGKIDLKVIKSAKSGGTSTSKELGTNQFRSLADACRAAETYDEIRLLIQYKTAKDDKDKKSGMGKSWSREYKNYGTIGDVVISELDKIRDICGGDGRETLEAMRLFFGYLYQSARVWSLESAAKDNRNNSNGGNRNNYENNAMKKNQDKRRQEKNRNYFH